MNPSAGFVISISTALLTKIAILITNTNEYISKLKIRHTEIIDRIIVITLLYEKTLKQSMVDEKWNEAKALELKKIYNQYLDKRKEIKKNTSFKVEDVFDDKILKNSISPEQITKLRTFSAKKISVIILV